LIRFAEKGFKKGERGREDRGEKQDRAGE